MASKVLYRRIIFPEKDDFYCDIISVVKESQHQVK